ncbi:Phosphotyrosyl phosphatase activator, PTPA, partial [Cinara cedri]
MDKDNTVIWFPASANLPVEIIGRRVYCRRDMLRWECSQAQADMRVFIERMNVVLAERYRPTATATPDGTENVRKAAEVLGQVTQWAELNRPARNDFMVVPAFGKFHAMLRSKSHDLLVRMYGRPAEHRTVELPAYLEKSFGDADTMEYGPEHEISFCMFLIALFKLHHLTCADEHYVVSVLFD